MIPDKRYAVFATRIKSLRRARRLSQQELAKALGVHPGHYSRYETQDSLPSLLTLVSIADYFEVSTDYLLNRTDEMR
ncbi:MAG: XRE family transcriptional regulator [Hyphomicrobiaceae bacterium]|nr:MAG: XRE family transcriptional regulator [Hyphomicrobiaceae bacterium]